MKRTRLALGAVVVLLAMIGAGLLLTRKPSDSASPAPASGTTPGWVDARTNRAFDLVSMRAAAPHTVLWFVEPGCGAAGESTEASAAAHRLQVRVVAIAAAVPTNAMADFARRHHLGQTQISVDGDGSIWRRYGVNTPATTILLDQSGGIIQRWADAPFPASELRTRL